MSTSQLQQGQLFRQFSEIFHYLSFFSRMSATPKTKRSVEARRRRNQKKREKAGSREDSSQRSHLLPTPYLEHDESYEYRCLALDCEMIAVQASVSSDRTRLASVGIVDINGVPLYEVYVPPPGGCRLNSRSRQYCPVTDQQFAIARGCNGTDFEHVRSHVLGLLRRCKFVIGHAIRNDLTCLSISEGVDLPNQVIIDIQKHYKQRAREQDFRVRGFHLPPLSEPSHDYSLKTLARHLLHEDVQQGDHSAIEDARTTMKLYALDQFKIEEPERLRNIEWWGE